MDTVTRDDNNTGWVITDRALQRTLSLLTLLGVLVAATVAWTSSQLALHDKVGMREYQEHVTDVRLHVQQDTAKWNAVVDEQRRQTLLLERLDLRVTSMYCDGKPAGCR